MKHGHSLESQTDLFPTLGKVDAADTVKVKSVEPNHHVLICQDNQIALEELLSSGTQFQLIYMDPPYNTGRLRGARKFFGDTNKHEWREHIRRTVMKSHAVLRDTGFMAISINQMELFNLKPAIDEIFGAECFVGIFPVKIRHKDRQLMINATFHDLFEYLLVYRKKRNTRFFTTQKGARTDKFIYALRVTLPTQERQVNGKRIEIYSKGHYEILKVGYTQDSLRRYVIAGKLATANWSGEWYESHLRSMGDDLLIRVWGLENEGLGYRWFQTGNANRRSGVYFQSQLTAGRPILPTNDLDYTEVVPTIFREGGPGCDFKDSKKPELLLTFLMNICTQPGDLVLDPYAGSGTTLAVAAKLNRTAVIIENDESAIKVIGQRVENLRGGKDVDGVRYDIVLDVRGLPTRKPVTPKGVSGSH